MFKKETIAAVTSDVANYAEPPQGASTVTVKAGDSLDNLDGLTVPELRQLVANGHIEAKAKLGILYLEDFYNQKIFDKGWELLKVAAFMGSADANYELGLRYREGFGVDPDATAALYHLRQAAELGNLDAMLELGNPFFDEEWVVTDIKEANTWLVKAANLVLCLNTLSGRFPDQIPAIAIGHFEEAAERSCVEAMVALGFIYRDGTRVKPDSKKAAHWFLRAAKCGDGDAIFEIARAYRDGDGVKKDMKKSVYWYQRAANMKDPDAMFELGAAYLYGLGFQNNYEAAIYWFERSAMLGRFTLITNRFENLLIEHETFVDIETVKEIFKRFKVIKN